MGPFYRSLNYLYRLFHPHETLPLGCVQHEGSEIHLCLVEETVQLESLPQDIDLSTVANPTALPEDLVDAVRNLKPYLPIGCELLGQDDLNVVGAHPIDAGGFADVWVGKRNDGTVVAIKSHRHRYSSSCLPIYSRLYKEALTCSSLDDGGENFVPFIGVYSTQEHPFALVFKYMDHLNLSVYLRNNRDAGRVDLLLGIARGLRYMHNLGFVHGNLKTTNVLVDSNGRAHIGGLTTAIISSATEDIDRSFPGAAPELIDARPWGFTDTGATTASDVYAFGVLAWEVFAGQLPFPGESVVTVVHSMFNGRRPARPDHPELSDRVWKLIKGSWKANPAQRKTIVEIVAILEAEASAE